ncbi:putative LicD-family phosphotransferase [Lachnospiraceae bacterium TWA4]|nr:putative LicD-family phosphotransferase [Lachnospiraceae bacterium TWA4]
MFSFLPLRTWLIFTEWVISICKDEKSNYVIIPSGSKHAYGETYPRNWMFPSKKVLFHRQYRNTFKQPRKYLKQLYGNYKKIPPVEERLHHNVVKYQREI